MPTDLLSRLNDALPQTQCRQCGHPGCAAYAEAIAAGEPINRCPPGGAAGVLKLARLTGREALPLDPDYGTEAPLALAAIDASRCIGCRFCARACPTDAVTGAPKHLFAVLPQYCTGCALCLPACPMDCIAMVNVDHVWDDSDARRARVRFERKTARLAAKTATANRQAEASAAAKSAVMSNLSSLLAARRAKARP